jgi:hypothetical protein
MPFTSDISFILNVSAYSKCHIFKTHAYVAQVLRYEAFLKKVLLWSSESRGQVKDSKCGPRRLHKHGMVYFDAHLNV